MRRIFSFRGKRRMFKSVQLCISWHPSQKKRGGNKSSRSFTQKNGSFGERRLGNQRQNWIGVGRLKGEEIRPLTFLCNGECIDHRYLKDVQISSFACLMASLTKKKERVIPLYFKKNHLEEGYD